MGPSELYVGRKTAHLPESKWHNPFHIRKGGRSREQAVASFKDHLRTSKELHDALADLSGRSLRCHCQPSQQCHIDV